MIFAVLFPLWGCYVVTGYFFPPSHTPRIQFFYRLLFAVAMFFGFTSFTFYMGKITFGLLQWPFSIMEVAAFGLILIVFSFLRKHSGRSLPVGTPHPEAPPKWRRHLGFAFLVLLLLVAIQSLMAYRVNPHGWWDAWAIWNLRARALFLGDAHWLRAFSTDYAHTDYPLLLPAAIARLWHYLGSPHTIVPAICALVFCTATIGMLTGLLSTLRGKTMGLLAGIVLMGSHKFIQISTYQIADTPLAFYFLATLSALCLFVRHGLSRHLYLAGMMAGFAAWTKNEGVLFLIACGISFAIVYYKQKPVAEVAKALAVWTLGLLPVALVVIGFKLAHAPANDLFSGLEVKAILAHVTDASRYLLIFIEWLDNLNKIAKVWLFLLPLLMILLLRKYSPGGERFYFQVGMATTLLMVAGYSAVYLLTPHNLQWHIDTSMRRLVIHLWPLMLLCYFLRLPVLADDDTIHLSGEK